MKKKIIASLLVFILFFSNIIFTNSSFAVTFTRSGGSNVNNVATLIEDGMYIDAGVGYLANTIAPYEIKVYNYNTTTEQTCTGHTAVSYSANKYYLKYEDGSDEHLDYAIQIAGGNTTLNNVATLLFKGAIRYANKTYDVKLNIVEISTTGSATKELYIPIANRKKSSSNIWDMSTYTDGVIPTIGLTASSTWVGEIKVDYYIIDSSGNEYPITGFFGLDDIDLNQGIHVEGITASAENLYKKTTLLDSVKYKNANGGTYFYSSTSANTSGNGNCPFLLVKNNSKLTMTLTWESLGAATSLMYRGAILSTYKRINTEVTGGRITPTVTGIQDGEYGKIMYVPYDSSTQYLKSVKVDGVEQDLTTYADSYSFENITEDHDIKVEYANYNLVSVTVIGGDESKLLKVKNGDNCTITYSPFNTNMELKSIKVDGASVSTSNHASSYTLTNVSQDHTIVVEFANPDQYGGSTADQTQSQYYNTNGSITTVTFTLANNGYTRTGYTFKTWAEGSASGTQHAPGSTMNFAPAVDSTQTTKEIYAVWEYYGNAPVKFVRQGKIFTSAFAGNNVTGTMVDYSNEEYNLSL